MSLKPTAGLGFARTASKSMPSQIRYAPAPPRVEMIARTFGSRNA